MKRITIIAMAMLGLTLHAQEVKTEAKVEKKQIDQRSEEGNIKTLFSPDAEYGAYLGINMKQGQMNGESAFFVGGRLGWVMDHMLTIGFSGYGFASTQLIYDLFTYTSSHVEGGYGGLFIEPILFPKQAIHVSFPVDFGIGTVFNYQAGDYQYNQTGLYDNEGPFSDPEMDLITVIEPGVEIEFNLLKHLRLGGGVSYRFIKDLDLDGIGPDALNGLSGGISLKVGAF